MKSTKHQSLRVRFLALPLIENLYRRAKTIAKKAKGLIDDALLPSPSVGERARIQELRSAVRNLPPIPESADDIEEEWQRHLKTLRHSIETRDPRNFLNWEVVRHTMFHEAQTEEFDYLQNLSTWGKYESALGESPIGRPQRYAHLASTSGNLVHHAYNYSQLFDASAFPVDVGQCHHIFEFGGGYGSFARFVYQMGFSGKYTLFDLPELTRLQRYFLSSLEHLPISVTLGDNPGLKNGVSLISELADVDRAVESRSIDVFVATWSISESPLSIRKQIFNRIRNPSFYIIAYFENFNGIDNVSYFKQFVNERGNYAWTEYSVAHLPGSRYLLGRKIYSGNANP